MRNVLTFIWKNHFFFLFVLLEIISLVLVVKSNSYQGSVIINSTSDFTGGILQTLGSFGSVFKLRDSNTALAEENARFHNRDRNSYIITDTNTFYVNDTLYEQEFVYVSAKVISNSTNRRNNYLKLNKGRRHGITKDMAVVAPNGVVGQVIEVSDHFSSVMSVINKHSRVSAKLKASNQVGTLIWNGNNYRRGTLVDIPLHVQMRLGDSIITSGYSHIFPEGHLIGVVEDYRIEKGANFYTVDVAFTIDYNKVLYVNVIKSLHQKELQQLETYENQN